MPGDTFGQRAGGADAFLYLSGSSITDGSLRDAADPPAELDVEAGPLRTEAWTGRLKEWFGPFGPATGSGCPNEIPKGGSPLMTETPARLSPDTGEFGQDLPTVMIDGESCLDMADGQCGWCEDALTRMPFPCSPELLNPLNRLHAVNSRQWDAEDRVRAAGDEEIPAIKREIDELNSLRHELIEQVDRIFGAAWGANQNVPPLTESIGSALDRLSVLTLRIVYTGRLVGDDAGAVERVAILGRQRDDLVWSIAVACEDLVSGRRRTPRPERMKLYGKPGR